MSNTKWRKAFRILSCVEPTLTRCHWKFVGDPRVFKTRIPPEKELAEWHLEDGYFQPEFVDSEIEWVEIPAQYEAEINPRTCCAPEIIYQDISNAIEALAQRGKFPVGLTATGFRIHG